MKVAKSTATNVTEETGSSVGWCFARGRRGWRLSARLGEQIAYPVAYPALMAVDQGRRFWPGSVLLVVVGLMAAAVAIYSAAARAVSSLEPPPGVVMVVAMVALVCMPVHLFLHELGHLLAALAARLRVTEVAVLAGPATRVWTVARARVRIGWRGRQCHVRFGAPPHQPAVRARTIIVVLAGPLANVATAGVCWVMAESTADVLVRSLWLAVGVGAAALGVANLVPARAREAITGATDGLLLVRWLSRPEGLRTALTLEYLAWRGRGPGNRWRRFEDLRPVPPDVVSADVVSEVDSARSPAGRVAGGQLDHAPD